jgi:biotin carboxyl carrier protein
MEAPSPRLIALPPDLAALVLHVTPLASGAWRVHWRDGAESILSRDRDGALWITHAAVAGAPPLRLGPIAAPRGASSLFGGRATASDDPNAVVSPVAGIARKCLVAPGQAVKQGEPLVVVESMKMEITLTAPRDGVVAAVTAPVGAKVERGARVVTLS